MKFKIFFCGKDPETLNQYYKDLKKRLSFWHSLESFSVKKESLLAKLKQKKSDQIWISLDPNGNSWNDEKWLEFYKDFKDYGQFKEANFIIGDAFGLDDSIKKLSSKIISLGPITLTHGLAKLVLTETLYRATARYYGHPFHK